MGSDALLGVLLAGSRRDDRLTHVEHLPARAGRTAEWPAWADEDLVGGYRVIGVDRPWVHQVQAAEAVRAGRHTVLATSTGSGKSLGFWLPALTETRAPTGLRRGTTLYLCPTKALAADQLAGLERLLRAGGVGDVRPATCDGDTDPTERRWVQEHADVVLTNPDFLHFSLLPGHRRWARLLRGLRHVVVDECHAFRGVFGAHVAAVLRRLRRVAAHYGSEPTFVLASATTADPAAGAARLLGVPAVDVVAVTEDTSPLGRKTFALWQPPELPGLAPVLGEPERTEVVGIGRGDGGATDTRGGEDAGAAQGAGGEDAGAGQGAGGEGGEQGAGGTVGDGAVGGPSRPGGPSAPSGPSAPGGPSTATPPPAGYDDAPTAPAHRTATAEMADLLTDLVLAGARTLAFTRSRRAAESVAAATRDHLDEVRPGLGGAVAAYRGGYLPEERRALERGIRSGELLALATTNALELGVDISGLDAVLIAGWPGTRMSLWQQAGRAGRAGADGLVALIAREDPLDTYLVHHPEAIFGASVEATVFDPSNPYVLGPHLCAAAAEVPLRADDLALFGPGTAELLDVLCERGALRRRSSGWYWTHAEPATRLTDLRGSGGEPVRVVESATGRLLGTVDAASADATVHTGAVYVHQGATFVVEDLDLAGSVALVSPRQVDYGTWSRWLTSIDVRGVRAERAAGPVRWGFGPVDVTTQVVSYQKRHLPDLAVLGQEPLDLPARTLPTTAVWWTAPPEVLEAARVDEGDAPGALHAAEHASIGLLPLLATCDRWDLGGVSTALHVDTECATVFVYDAYPGGAGFAERGFDLGDRWLRATRDAIHGCGCSTGCPACVQSPKCGNGNNPLEKDAAVRLLDAVLAHG